MTTTVIKSIGTAPGRDYALISAWVADRLRGRDVTATGSDTIEIGEVYNDGPILEPSVVVSIAADTIDAAHPITLRAAANQGWNNKPGDSALPLTGYDESRGACVRLNTTGAALTIGGYVLVDGLQFTSVSASGNPYVLPGATALGYQNCILDSGTTSSTNGAFITVSATIGPFRNNIVIIRNAVNRPMFTSGTAVAGTMEFNTFWNQSGSTGTSSSGSFMVSPTTAKPSFKFQNNLMIGWAPGVSYSNNNFTDAALINNASNSLFTGFSSTNLASITTTNEVNSTTDVRPKSTSTIKAAGVPSSTGTTLDVFGRTRSTSAPTIGAVEYIVAAPPPPPPAAIPRRWAHLPFGQLH